MREFWAIMDVHMVRLGHKKRFINGGTFASVEDVDDFEKHLIELGAI